MVRPSQSALLHCLEEECKECQEINDILYCHYGVRMMEVERGAKCQHKQYKKVIPVFIHSIPDIPRMTLQQGEKYGDKK